MPRPELDYAVIMEIMNARAEGLTLGQIQERMKVIREASGISSPMPNQGAIAKYAREHDEHPPNPEM